MVNSTVKPVLRDHSVEAVKVVSQDRWSLSTGDQDISCVLDKFSMSICHSGKCGDL